MTSQIVLGLGAGHCGLNLLANILDRQNSSRVTMEQPPLLPWQPRSNGPGIEERIQRWKSDEFLMTGDVAAFYLPYVKAAFAAEPTLRMVCLKRPREEIIAAFCQQLDRTSPVPTNHWASHPAPGWYHDPLWTQTFPQYETQERVEGIGQYWDEYYTAAEDWQRQLPDHFRIWDTKALTEEPGVREVLDFVGLGRDTQTTITGRQPAQLADLKHISHAPQARYPNPLDPRRCVILVPFSGFIHQDCDMALKELERRGYEVRRVGGYAAIDQGRNQMATDALIQGFEETMWIDSDVIFHPDDIDRLRSHALPIVCGIYPQKGKRALASHVAPGTPRMTFGEGGGLNEILYAGTGFLLVRL
jgi:hypothetical protein